MNYVVWAEETKDGQTSMYTEAEESGVFIADIAPAVLKYMQELDSDYINQNFGYMQDESFCAGFELARRVALSPASYEHGLTLKTLEKVFKSYDRAVILDIDPLVVKDQVEAYEAEKARAKAAAKTGKVDREDLDKAAAKAVEAFRKMGANYVQIAQAVTKAMAEAVEAEA